jgi:signal transduction histidine kinase
VAELRLEEREFLHWLRGVEKRAIIPLKWSILTAALMYWFWARTGDRLPPVPMFMVFVGYFMANLGESYLLWFSRVGLRQVRAVCFVSYCLDVAFITALVILDGYFAAQGRGAILAIGRAPSDFYVFYFLLILRGFALFPGPRENFRANVVVGVIYIFTLIIQDATFPAYTPTNVIRVVFIWLVILMSWFIVEIITRQKEEVMRARENLIRSENMITVGELAAGVAHEINNPIGIISVYAEFLKKNAAPDDPRMEDFDAILTEAKRSKKIISELLDYARPAPPHPSPTDLRQINDEVLNLLFRHDTENPVTIERNYDAHPPLIMVDSGQIKQALLNVYMNARQAMGDSGSVLQTTIQADHSRDGVRLIVKDNGGGIKPETLNRVFDPFFTQRTGGTGLGLSITRRIIEHYDGQISLRSTPGDGVTVEIFFPALRHQS